ncbi:MAG: hypothetical protein AAB899_04330 [Patescibacteria group bacterium]
MRFLVQEKGRAIALRKKGYSYRDILREVHVSKSSISLWLQDLPLTKDEKTYLKSRRDSNISRGRMRAAASLHELRLSRDNVLLQEARKEFVLYREVSLFTTGIALYWAEGSKRTSVFSFANSDSEMINLMLSWIERFFGVGRKAIKVRLYIHKPYAHENCESWWSREISVPLSNFQKTIYKPTGLLVKKRPDYKGCLRIELGTTYRLRKMQFWQQMLIEHYRN